MSSGTILVVESNPETRGLARKALRRAGFRVASVGLAEEAVKHAHQQGMVAVVLDAQQARPELLSALHDKRRVPVILTFERPHATEGPEDIDRTQPGVAADDFLEKPFTPKHLLETVDRVLAGSRQTLPPLPPTAAAVVRRETVDAELRPRLRSGLRRRPTAAPPVVQRLSHSGVFELPDFDDDKTDIFPFAHLVEHIREETQSARVAVPLADSLSTFLKMEGVEPTPEILVACVRACDWAMTSPVRRPLEQGGSKPAIEGGIPQLSIDQVLQLAMAVAQPSRCRISQGRVAIDLFYENGNITFARQVGLPDGFLLGQLLVASGRVNRTTLSGALSRPQDGTRLGERLRAMGIITDEELANALHTQTEELVYEVVRWSSGTFAIYSNNSPPPEAEWARQTHGVPHLLLEGMRRLDEWRRIQPAIGDLHAVLNRPKAPSPKALAGLSAEDREVLEFIDGRRTVAELINSVARPTFQVYRMLHNLADRRLVLPVVHP